MKRNYLLLGSAALFIIAFFTLRFQNLPGTGVISMLATLGIAMPTLYALFGYLGARLAVVSLAGLGIFAFTIETIGTVTGVPYGSFFYGGSLGPKLVGLVPLVLPLSYAPLVIGAVAAASNSTLRKRSGGWSAWVLRSALLLVLIDGVLDPGAAALGFWVWPEGGLYYGVPLSNYLGWFLSGAVASALMLSTGHRVWREYPPLAGLLDSLVLSVAFWSGIAAFSGLLLPVILGPVLFVYFLRRRSMMPVVPYTSS